MYSYAAPEWSLYISQAFTAAIYACIKYIGCKDHYNDKSSDDTLTISSEFFGMNLVLTSVCNFTKMNIYVYLLLYIIFMIITTLYCFAKHYPAPGTPQYYADYSGYFKQ
jgi:hypothetical protein